MKHIPLTQGQFAIVDDADFEWLTQWKWQATRIPTGGYYATRKGPGTLNRECFLMHRAILCVRKGFSTDHKNGNGLDNQRDNLRECTHVQNMANRKKDRGKLSSKYKGVSMRARQPVNCWGAEIQCRGKRTWLGSYASEEKAARAYDARAKEVFGEFANLNFKE